MEVFDPTLEVENGSAILDAGSWPIFHDAIVYSLIFWRGDMRPGDDIWVAPTIEATFELAALEFPYIVELRFHQCDHISMENFDHNNDIYDLSFSFENRGYFADGVTPLPPYICVAFERGGNLQPLLKFKCFRIEALGRRSVTEPPCR